MADFFTNEQMKDARMADLHEFLLEYHDDEFIKESSCIRMRDNNSLAIKRGYSGYIDFSTNETGNSVDFLVRYMGYSVVEAVLALCGEYGDVYVSHNERMSNQPILEDVPVEFPEPLDGSYRNLFAYLMERKITREIIQFLIDKKLLYQEGEHNNMVFINKARDFAEIHGTYSYGKKSFHSCRKSRPDRFWWFCKYEKAEKAYVCEAAIDAISLCLLHEMAGIKEPAYYISIGGVSNQKTIDRIKRKVRTVLAVDNDVAGELCRNRNPEVECIIPRFKDWNDDLKAYNEGMSGIVKYACEMIAKPYVELMPRSAGTYGKNKDEYANWNWYDVIVKTDEELEPLFNEGYVRDEEYPSYLRNEKEKRICVVWYPDEMFG